MKNTIIKLFVGILMVILFGSSQCSNMTTKEGVCKKVAFMWNRDKGIPKVVNNEQILIYEASLWLKAEPNLLRGIEVTFLHQKLISFESDHFKYTHDLTNNVLKIDLEGMVHTDGRYLLLGEMESHIIPSQVSGQDATTIKYIPKGKADLSECDLGEIYGGSWPYDDRFNKGRFILSLDEI